MPRPMDNNEKMALGAVSNAATAFHDAIELDAKDETGWLYIQCMMIAQARLDEASRRIAELTKAKAMRDQN